MVSQIYNLDDLIGIKLQNTRKSSKVAYKKILKN